MYRDGGSSHDWSAWKWMWPKLLFMRDEWWRPKQFMGVAKSVHGGVAKDNAWGATSLHIL